ncbi:bifunctional 4-hydroxy-2-oxoglutarate aldolase/2-dehydro-3-deoxy-phosphogluconate aldolase [Streptomyces sp. NPDC001288]|uniref:bifunctional 4-hydroxy-2-oxoglutarate aldolase/2-dehydro-3-deoxy-phosphogluconate aldolase n=1 Tax=unclassified Streptomyces TaxID=2593676 RepID=UPI00332AF1D3
MPQTPLPQLVVILRGLGPQDVLPAVAAMADAGARAFEVTMNSPDALRSIARLTERHHNVLIGAGTVRTPQQARQAAAAGARFALSPHTDPALIRAVKDTGMLCVPGAYTPTEIERAWRCGADVVKVFPCQPSGPAHVRAVREALDDVPLLACGGITEELGPQYLSAGCVSLGVGLGLLDAGAVRSRDWPALGAAVARRLGTQSP